MRAQNVQCKGEQLKKLSEIFDRKGKKLNQSPVENSKLYVITWGVQADDSYRFIEWPYCVCHSTQCKK